MRFAYLLFLGLLAALSLAACVDDAGCPSGTRKLGTRCIRLEEIMASDSDGAVVTAPDASSQVEQGTDAGVTACPEDERRTFYRDRDGDGFGGAESLASCEPPAGFVEQAGDCDDQSETVYPGATHGCNGSDASCGGDVDGSLRTAKAYYQDCDGDGFAADEEGAVTACEEPPLPSGCLAWTTVAPKTARTTDCDPERAEYYPGAPFGISPVGSASNDLNCDGRVEGSDEVFVEKYIHYGDEDVAWIPYGKHLPVCEEEYLSKLGWVSVDCPSSACVAWAYSGTAGTSYSNNGPGPCVRSEPSLTNNEENNGKFLPVVLGLRPDAEGRCSALDYGIATMLCR